MGKFSLEELLAAFQTSNVIILQALIEQGVVNKSAFIQYLSNALNASDPEPAHPAVAFVLSNLLKHLEAGSSEPTKTLQ